MRRPHGRENPEMALNEIWHRAHPMPKNPSRDERIAWHLEHTRECGCRPPPESLRDEVARRLGRV